MTVPVGGSHDAVYDMKGGWLYKIKLFADNENPIMEG